MLFHIGVPISKLKSKKKSVKKHPKKLDLMKTGSYTFKPYTGPRWILPSGSNNVSDSIKEKFSQFELCSMNNIFRTISATEDKKKFSFFYRNSIEKCNFDTLQYVRPEWKPPQEVISAIQRYYALEANEYKKVKALYIVLFQSVKIIKKIIHLYIIQKCLRNVKNINDVVTLDPPVKPVHVIDYKNRLSYVYEATTLKKTIENRLLYSDYMFHDPKMPINMLSNKPFSYGQLLSIIGQCKEYGIFSWILDRFRSCNCNLSVFEMQFRQQLKIQAILSHFKNQKDAKESVIDYFELHAMGLTNRQIDAFSKLYDINNSLHPYIQKWISVTREYYIALELKNYKGLQDVRVESCKLIDKAVNILTS